MTKRIRDFLTAQLTQGATPRSLAISCAVGAMCGCFPLFGTTTLIGFGLGVAFRLNQPALQAANYAMAPVQILLLPVLISSGEWMFGAEPVSLNPVEFTTELFHAPTLFFSHYGWAAAYASVAWVLVAPVAGFFVYAVLHAILRKGQDRLKRRS